MGACFSTAAAAAASTAIDRPTAKVVVDSGSLVEYSVPIRVSQVLCLNHMSASCFLCNADSLRYCDYVEALGPEEFIRLGQLYFILTLDKLHSVLSGSDMAALAVKASSALENLSKSRMGSRGTSTRVVPIHIDQVDGSDGYIRFNEESIGKLQMSSLQVRNKQLISEQEWPERKKMKQQRLNAIDEAVEEADG